MQFGYGNLEMLFVASLLLVEHSRFWLRFHPAAFGFRFNGPNGRVQGNVELLKSLATAGGCQGWGRGETSFWFGVVKGYPPGYLSRVKRTVVLYETESGARPVAKFLRKQTMQVRDAAIAGFKHIENDTGADHLFKKMVNTDDLWEIRIKYDKNIFRLLCFFDGAAIVVVASGFQKKTQKTPPQEIRTAETRKKDYFRRKSNG